MTASDSEAIDAWVESTLAAMTLDQKIGQMIVTGLEDAQISPEVCAFIKELAPGGITYQRPSLPHPDSVRQFSADLQTCARDAQVVPLLIMTAHEGEYVDRFQDGATSFPSLLAQGATGQPEVAFQVAYASGLELTYSGINMIMGPVADVLLNYDNEVVSQRTFGGNAEVVGEFVARAVAGYSQAGVIPVLKHFPGHGGVADDSHQVLPIDWVDRQALQENYLPPFRKGLEAGAPVVMLSHVAYPNITGLDWPATLAAPISRLLREDLSFKGVIMSDSMRMKALTRGLMTISEAGIQGVIAGVDLLLFNSPDHARDYHADMLVAMQQGRLSIQQLDDIVRRILALKAAWGLSASAQSQPPAPDWQAHQHLAEQVGRQAVALLKNEAGLLPISPQVRRILAIAPGTEWDLYPRLKARLEARGIEVELVNYPNPWDGPVRDEALLNNLTDEAAGYDLALVFTWQAHLNRLTFEDTWQARLVNKLLDRSIPLAAIAIKSPTDILEYPRVQTYLAMFGTTPGQEQALLDILLGDQEPQGQNPLPGLLPEMAQP
jgi:beta-N-acetylhexosaminidase